jgi:hypothetical protein
MKGYSRIGVGVRPDSGPLTDTMPSKVAPEVDDMLEMPKEVQGLGYGIELDANDQIDLGAIEMDRGEGSSSSSASVSLDQDNASEANITAVEDKEERDTEFPSTEVMKSMGERLASSDLATADLVSMVSTPSALRKRQTHCQGQIPPGPIVRDPTALARPARGTASHHPDPTGTSKTSGQAIRDRAVSPLSYDL